MNNNESVRLDQKVALFIGEKRVTRHIYDEGKTYNGITIMRSGLRIDIFDNSAQKRIYTVYGIKNFEIKKNCIITYNFSGECGAITYNGKTLLECVYSRIVEQDNYFIVTTKNETKGLYKLEDGALKEIIKHGIFSDIRISQNGITVYKNEFADTFKGYYSLDGEEIIKPIYVDISFANKGIHVSKDKVSNNKGYYLYSGKQIIPAEFQDIKAYGNCFVVSKLTDNGRLCGLYSADGKEILKTRYTMYDINSPYIIFYLGHKACAYDLCTGKRILPLKYKTIRAYYNVICATEDNQTFSIFSGKTGKKLLEDKFDLISGYDPWVVAPYILMVTKNNKTYYYLTQYNILLEKEKYDVTYSEEYKEVLITDDNNKELPFTEWIKSKK